MDPIGPASGLAAGSDPGVTVQLGTGRLSTTITSAAAAESLQRLFQGNQRFRSGQPQHPNQSPERLQELVGGQHPGAMVLACSDSRVSPEILFDQGIGDVFVQRVAGNLLDDAVLGSIEYAAQHLEVPLLVVLGHEGCGAVSATLDVIRTGAAVPGKIASIVATIRPAAESVLVRGGDVLHEAVLANVRWTVAGVLQRSQLVRERVDAGRMSVVGAHFGLRSGQVNLVE